MSNDLGSDKPICAAIVVCNEIIEDKRTNNKTLVSLFNTIGVPAVPFVYPRLFIMASLTNLRGRIPIEFRITSPSNTQLFRAEGEAMSDDPLIVLDLLLEVIGLPLPEFGTYFIDVFSGHSQLGNRRINVTQISFPEGQ